MYKRQTDIIGMQLGGTIKNVFAIGAGLCEGLNLGDNAQGVTATYATRDFDLRKDWVQCRNTICGFGDTLRTDLFDGIDETTFLTTVCLYTSYLNKQSGKTNTISCKKKDVLGLPYWQPCSCLCSS